MFRKRQPDKSNKGYGAQQPGRPGSVLPAAHAPPTRAITPEPPRALLKRITFLVLSQDLRCAQELLGELERVVGKGHYGAAWVPTIEKMLEAMRHHRYDLCLLDLASPELGRLEERGYQLFGKLPYVAVLITASMNAQVLQELEKRGYYGYVGYPFDGQAVDGVLRELLQEMPGLSQEAPSTQGNGSRHEPQTNRPQPTPVSAPVAGQGQPGASYSRSEPLINESAAPAPLAPPFAQVPQPPIMPVSPDAVPLTPTPNPTASLTVPAAPAATPVAPITEPAPVPPAPAAPLAPAPAASLSLLGNGGPFAIQPQLVRHRGLFVCWSPFDGAQRTLAALNLATALAFGGFRTLVGELRRPAGPLSSYLQLTGEELSRSLLAAAYASERLQAQKRYVLDQELLENHLLNAILLDPHNDESPEVHFFLSGPSSSPHLLFNAPALDSNQSTFIPELLQMIRQYWDFAFIVVGSSPVDKLHWQAFRACDRLLVFLPPDEAYLTQAGHLLPAVLSAAHISPTNVDIILTQIDRCLLTEQMEPIRRFLAKTSSIEDHQISPFRGIMPGRPPPMEKKHLRMLERQLVKLAVDDSLRNHLEGHVKTILKAAGLEDKLVGTLPDALPFMQNLRRKNRPLLPLVMQREFVTTSYVLAIRDLLEAWIQVAGNAPGVSEQRRVIP